MRFARDDRDLFASQPRNVGPLGAFACKERLSSVFCQYDSPIAERTAKRLHIVSFLIEINMLKKVERTDQQSHFRTPGFVSRVLHPRTPGA